ncbi:hypothetical protein E3Q08_03840 [Wallemia mellicola]|nr:hypothetical protein E3Q08_03840 [Wallemia mellicola]
MIDKYLSSIKPLLDSNDNYSAHQRVRTISTRLSKNGKSKESIELLFTVSKSLLEKSEWGSAIDCSILMLNQLSNLNDWDLSLVTQLISLTTNENSWRKKLIDNAITTSATSFKIPSGHPDLLDFIGNLYFKERSYPLAEYYLILASKKESAVTLAKLYIQWSQSPNQHHNDIGRYALRGVLAFILAEQVEAAITFTLNFLIQLQLTNSTIFLENQSLDGITLTHSHTLNFAQFIIASIQRSSTSNIAQEWKSLVSHFKNKSDIINSQPVAQACTEIGSLYFDIRPVNTGGNMMDIMSSLLGGGAPSNQSKLKLLNKNSAAELD